MRTGKRVLKKSIYSFTSDAVVEVAYRIEELGGSVFSIVYDGSVCDIYFKVPEDLFFDVDGI